MVNVIVLLSRPDESRLDASGARFDLFVEESFALLGRHDIQQFLGHGIESLESLGAGVADLPQLGVFEVDSVHGVALLLGEAELAAEHLGLFERLFFGRAGRSELVVLAKDHKRREQECDCKDVLFHTEIPLKYHAKTRYSISNVLSSQR